MLYLFNPMQGRIGRGYWWMLQLIIFTLAFACLIFSAVVLADPSASYDTRTSSEQAMFVFVVVMMVYMNFCACQNRLRDSGRSGFWYLTFLLPYAGTGLMIYFCGVEAGGNIDRTPHQRPRPTPEPQSAPEVAKRASPTRPVFGRR